jgi:hypothetical protein
MIAILDAFFFDWSALLLIVGIGLLALIGLGTICAAWIEWTFGEIIE